MVVSEPKFPLESDKYMVKTFPGVIQELFPIENVAAIVLPGV